MYSITKRWIKSLIPEKLLLKNESFLRFIHSILYIGKNHECHVCNTNLRSFITLENGDLLCPSCGSLARNRRLWHLLNEEKSIKGNVLHFSPTRSLFRKFKKVDFINYFSSDFEGEFIADYNFDITNINQPKESFNLIICYHILEHVVDDKKAISELYRVLKPNGIIYIQTPFKDGDIYEDYSITSPKEREIHFGQNDHVRIYSVNGLKKRLENIGFKVKIKYFKEDENDFKNGYSSHETVLIVTK